MRQRTCTTFVFASLTLFLLLSCKTPSSVSEEKTLSTTESNPTTAGNPAATYPFPLELGEVPFVDADGNGEDFWVEKLMARSDKTVQGLKDSTGEARRSAHAKAHGCVTATFRVLPNRPTESKVGIFEQDHQPYPAWIRFSNAFPSVGSDLTPDGRGMAIKVIFDPQETSHPGNAPKMLPGQEGSNAVDFAFVTGPTFPTRDVREYMELQESLPTFLATHPSSALIVKEIAVNGSQLSMTSPLYGTYWSMGAYKLGEQAVKYKTRPCPTNRHTFTLPSLGNDYLRDSMVKWLTTDRKEACFEFGVQFQKDAVSMPVEDPTVEWRESQTLLSRAERLVTGTNDPISKFIPLAEIKIPPQSFTSGAPGSDPQDKFCERMSFNPWRTIPSQRPLGNLMRARLKIYAGSLKKRHELNGAQPVAEILTGTKADIR